MSHASVYRGSRSTASRKRRSASSYPPAEAASDPEEVPDGRARRVETQGLVEVRARRRLVAGLDVVARARQEVGERRPGLGRREKDQEGEDHRGCRADSDGPAPAIIDPCGPASARSRPRGLARGPAGARTKTGRPGRTRAGPVTTGGGHRPGRREAGPARSARQNSRRAASWMTRGEVTDPFQSPKSALLTSVLNALPPHWVEFAVPVVPVPHVEGLEAGAAG